MEVFSSAPSAVSASAVLRFFSAFLCSVLKPLPYAGVTGTSAAGNRIKNRVPVGKLSSTRIVPLCSAIIRLAIANPNPVPRP